MGQWMSEAGLDRTPTLVSAPAGFGKTTLLSEWIHCRGAVTAHLQVAWLSLDEGDNDPARFLAYFLAALQRVDPAIGQAAQAMLQAPHLPPPETFLTSLINGIAATPNPFVLILDDYHLIHALPIHQQLAFLLEHQPPPRCTWVWSAAKTRRCHSRVCEHVGIRRRSGRMT